MPVKALDGAGSGTTFDIICSTLFAIENGADVINMSFGYEGDSSQILYNAIEYAKTFNEIPVVVSAGNDGDNNGVYPHYPANYSNSNLISVAADTFTTNAGRQLTSYSCYNDSLVDISAFGTMESTWPGGGTLILSGTSMAAPQIAAAAALARPYLGTASDIKNIIMAAGTPLMPIGKPIWTDDYFDMGNYISILEAAGTGLSCDASDFGKETNFLVYGIDI